MNKHKDFLETSSANIKVFGGGMWRLDKEEKTVLISGRSTEFGNFDPRFLMKFFPDSEMDMDYVDDTYAIHLSTEDFNNLQQIL